MVIGLNQEAWLKPCIELNTELRKKANKDFEKDFFKFTNNSVFGKDHEECKKVLKHQAFDNRQKKKLLRVRAKLSHSEMVVR